MEKLKSTEMADSLPELPQDLIEQVVLRLPPRPIGRFRCVSKLWWSRLSSRKFAKSHFKFHLQRAATPKAIGARLRYTPHPRLITFPVDGGDGRSRTVISPFFENAGNGLMKLAAAGSGFVLVQLENGGNRVLNPVTSESFVLPGSPLSPYFEGPDYASLERVKYGMGYDSLSDDFKIVEFVYDEEGCLSLGEPDRTYMSIYSFKMKCWTRVIDFPYFLTSHQGTFMNGYLHWVANKAGEGRVIFAFHLGREVFEEIPLPTDSVSRIFQVTVLRGCLAMVCFSEAIYYLNEVWVMKEYGKQESWEKLVIDSFGRPSTMTHVVSLSAEGEFVLAELDNHFILKVFVYNSETRTWRDFVADHLPDDFDDQILTFSECLLSPNHIAGE